ncbi:MAG: hypothetical protein AAGA81_07785 [Acidobacteriota bacterium]
MSREPERVELPAPSRATLLRSVAAALFIAALSLVFFVLPAEYGIDPTGLGAAMGLDQLAGTSLAEPLNQALPGLAVAQDRPFKTERQTLELYPGEQMELKMAMSEGDTVVFAWTASAPLYSDFHAEPYGELPGQDIRYEEAPQQDSANGSLHAPFDGHHGWYWRNENETEVTVEIELTGFFSALKERRAP